MIVCLENAAVAVTVCVDKQVLIFTSELEYLLRLTFDVASRGDVIFNKLAVQIREASTNVWIEGTPTFTGTK